MEKITRLAGLAHMSDADYAAFIEKEKKAYKKRLKTICPSKSVRKMAKELAEGDNPCGTCIYCDGMDECRVPHTDAYVYALGIYPCYEGILLLLCKNAERQEEELSEALDEADELLGIARSLLYDNLTTINTLSAIIIEMANSGGGNITPISLKFISSIFDEAQKMLEDIDSGEYDVIG